MYIPYNGCMKNLGSTQSRELRSRGRPREFNMEEAIDNAIVVFRERGYHATSIADLTNAMNLASGSIYKAFKDKRAIFIAAFDQYVSARWSQLNEELQELSNGRDKIRRILNFYVKSSSNIEGQRGCLVVSCAAELSTFDDEIANRVKEALNKNEVFLVKLIQQGQSDGSIKSLICPKASARLMLCVIQGMRVLGKTGRTNAEMMEVADAAMTVLE
jgi:TetR/AcrR family transcriptional regulator, transcriptional repressor for nem operon